LQNFAAEILLMEHRDWSIGSVYKHRSIAIHFVYIETFESLFPV